jgi:hypothetical protein
VALGEFGRGFIRIESDRLRVSADEGAVVDAAGPVRTIAFLERCVVLGPHLRGGGNLGEREVLALSLSAEPVSKCATLRDHG